MAAIYPVTEHKRLSAEAAANPNLAAIGEEAELLLGLDGTEYAGADAEKATLAVVRQINKLVRLESREDADATGESKGDQSLTFAKRKDGLVEVMDEQAVRMVYELAAKAEAEALEPPALLTSRTTSNEFVW